LTAARTRSAGLALAAALFAAGPAAEAQSLTVRTEGESVHVRASGFGFLEGPVLALLRDGRSVTIDLILAALPGPRQPPLTQATQRFTVSFDLWEERFAVTRVGTPPRSISHLRREDTEAWCLATLTVPKAAVSRSGPGAPFWLRLEYRVVQPATLPTTEEETGLSLRGLIDRLSRRSGTTQLARTVESGPFRLME
jgi:hypothetical protein